MIRILFMHHVSSIGGGSYCMLSLINNVDRRRYEPVVALREEGPLAERIKSLGYKVIIIPSMLTLPYNGSLIQRHVIKRYIALLKWSRIEFEKLLKLERIEIVYLNNMMLAPYLGPSKRVGCKTVLHVREHWPLNEHKLQLAFIRRMVYKNCDCLVAINHYSASIFPKLEATIIYDWIETKGRYKSIPLSDIFGEDMRGKKVLLYTGGFQSIKGPDCIINAFSEYVIGEDYRLLILGADQLPYTKGVFHEIKVLASKIGFPYPYIRMMNHLVQDKRIKLFPAVYELNHLIEQSHCFISYFTMPHANLAMAENIILSNACIAADTEEAREYSGNGTYAKLVEPNKPKLFAQSLLDFLNNIDYWKDAAKKGSGIIAAKFDKEDNVSRFLDMLNRLVNTN